jgi:hypothetical protein
MAKKRAKAAERSIPEHESHEDVPVSKQTAGGVTGAVLGGIVAGPVGALAGGAVGAMVGDASAKGKKPVKRAAEAIRDEITSGRAKAALKKVGQRIKALRPKMKKKKSAAKSAGKKKAASSKKAKSKVTKKKSAKVGRKKKAKKKA